MIENLKTNEVPASGSLNQFSFSEVITFLYRQKRTGILTLGNKNAMKSIYLKDGNAVFASSNLENERLGEMLVKTGKITAEEYHKSSSILIQGDERQGTILVELGYISEKDLNNELIRQIKEIIFSVFMWEDGVFSFKETSPTAEIIMLDMDMESLIQEGRGRKESKKNKEERSFLEKVNELSKNINSLTYYDILKIDINTPPSEIKKAYLKMAQNYHPDKFQDFPDSTLLDKLTTIIAFINKAYQTLSNETKKAEYNSIIFRKKTVKGVDSGVMNADEQFNRGMAEYKRGNFWGAADFLRWATRINPHNARYWAHLSLTLHKMVKRRKEAEEAILKAIELERHNADYYVHLGLIYLDAELKKRAISQFETALTWDPTNQRAQKELDNLKR